MVYSRAEVICSYLKMNNKDDEFKISLNNTGFNITQNKNKIFNFEHYNGVIMNFNIKSIMINFKRLDNTYKIFYINTSKMIKNYAREYKVFYNNTIELNKEAYIQYSLNKNYIVFANNINSEEIGYRINNRYYNRFIYKFHENYPVFATHFKYTNYKICIPNKYELLYYSKYFLVYL
jgi:hypothetical protein